MIWMFLGIAGSQTSNYVNHIDESEISLGGYIGQFIFIMTPLLIVLSYHLLKRNKETKHAIQ